MPNHWQNYCEPISYHLSFFAAVIFRQYAASIYGFVRFVFFVLCACQKYFRPLLSKVGGLDLVS